MYSLATHKAAIFFTYGSLSLKHHVKVSHKYVTTYGTWMQPIVLIARPRIKGVAPSLASE